MSVSESLVCIRPFRCNGEMCNLQSRANHRSNLLGRESPDGLYTYRTREAWQNIGGLAASQEPGTNDVQQFLKLATLL